MRVVPNAFPIMWPGLGGTGAAHEIIVETPDHAATLADLEDDAVADVFAMYARRWRALHARPDVEAVVLYRNEGSEAGASLRHAHAQAVALPTLPPRWVRTRAFARSRLRAASASVAADVLAEERAVGSRVLLDTDEFVAYHPFASLWPFEACIQPDVGVAPFGRLGDAERRALAILTRDVLRALRRVLGPFPYNLLLEAPAADLEREGLLRWRVRILPRLAHLAGFELATGMHVNTVPPEEACERVRRVLGR